MLVKLRQNEKPLFAPGHFPKSERSFDYLMQINWSAVGLLENQYARGV
jgi:hypothetical protein